jgi:hypothetical protein
VEKLNIGSRYFAGEKIAGEPKNSHEETKRNGEGNTDTGQLIGSIETLKEYIKMLPDKVKISA